MGELRPPIRRRVLMSVLGPLNRKALEAYQRMRVSQYEQVGLPERAVVFLGDSLCEQGLWNEWFPDLPVANRGVARETTAEVLGRLDSAVDADTATVILLAGTNDLTRAVHIPQIVANLGAILAGLRERAPGARILLHGLLPRDKEYRDEIVELNSRLAELAEQTGVELVDLWPVLAVDGVLDPQLTPDSIHLNGLGYAAWAAVLAPLLRR